jgi:hypothetical protein
VTSALEGGGWSAPRPGRFTPGKDPVPIVQEAEWAPGPAWTCAKNLASTGIRSLGRPARSQSLYRLSHPGPFQGGENLNCGLWVMTPSSLNGGYQSCSRRTIYLHLSRKYKIYCTTSCHISENLDLNDQSFAYSYVFYVYAYENFMIFFSVFKLLVIKVPLQQPRVSYVLCMGCLEDLLL